MRNMHLSYLTEMNGHIGELNKKYPSSKDPFYDPLQDVLIGTAVAYLNPISYIISIDQPLTILDTRGKRVQKKNIKYQKAFKSYQNCANFFFI